MHARPTLPVPLVRLNPLGSLSLFTRPTAIRLPSTLACTVGATDTVPRHISVCASRRCTECPLPAHEAARSTRRDERPRPQKVNPTPASKPFDDRNHMPHAASSSVPRIAVTQLHCLARPRLLHLVLQPTARNRATRLPGLPARSNSKREHARRGQHGGRCFVAAHSTSAGVSSYTFLSVCSTW